MAVFHAEHRDETRFDAVVMGLVFDDGSVVVVGPASGTSPDGIRTRPIVDVVGEMPAEGAVYRFTKEIWLTPEQAGLTAEEVTITTPQGDFPATEVTVPGSDKWAVLTHGRSGDRHDMLRMARPLHAAGYNLLLTTYAGDGAGSGEDIGPASSCASATVYPDISAARLPRGNRPCGC